MNRRASLIIPLLKQDPDWLAVSLNSALNQTIPVEVWVVVSPSTPSDHLAYLDGLSSKNNTLRVIPELEGKGYAGAFNAGIFAAQTQRVGFLLADDWLELDAVEHCLRYDADIVSTSQVTYAKDGTTEIEVCDISQREFEEKGSLALKADYLGHFLMFKRESLIRAGGLDMTIGETGPDDFDLIWTLLEQGASVRVESKRLYNYRDHNESWRLSLRETGLQIRDLERILRKHNVPVVEQREIIEMHRPWYGRTIDEVRRSTQKLTRT